ncbi:hypothetical protein MM239_01770 [Belliella sp. DSM 111904]|uniref:Xylose isomerase-like TIM barrel domain-containing protein n=1 Tax=Belliella filtrata TaxID=2923435 RepID=A0ABS9UVL4_9BACT|nr:hypothetical protein [Belliella filtrata]MCH7408109.1 hypothetical protein [Belliella filtrata]
MSKNCNDGSDKRPYLRLDINYGNCNELPEFSKGPKGNDEEKHSLIKSAGFEGIQDGIPRLCEEYGLGLTAHARINQVGELSQLAPVWKSQGFDCATIHLGWGIETDREVDLLVEDVLNTSMKLDFPIYLETHRATVTQDMQRTVALTERFPEIRFNGDFSHWYTGQEMVYGGIEMKWDFIQPIFERVRFLHGRIGNPGSIQVDIGDGLGLTYVEHFKEMWTRSFVGFLQSAQKGDFICFTAELLPASIYYARNIILPNGEVQEEGDRWRQAILLNEIAKSCWQEAESRLSLS